MKEIENIFKKLLNKKDLSILESEKLFDLIINQSINSVVISSLLTLLNIKGESFNEIYGAVKILKKRAKKYNYQEILLILVELEEIIKEVLIYLRPQQSYQLHVV